VKEKEIQIVIASISFRRRKRSETLPERISRCGKARRNSEKKRFFGVMALPEQWLAGGLLARWPASQLAR